MKYYILFNPFAGNGENAEKLQALAASFDDSEVVDMTKIESYAEFFKGIDASDTIVLCGGDGTINRFVNDTEGLNLKNDILYFALGTGNDFLKDIDGASPDKPIQINKYISDLPTVTVNGKTYRFLNNVGFGIDGYCCEVGDAMKAQGKKKINYTSIAINGLLGKYTPSNATVTVDGVKREYERVWLAPTMNGRYYGGGMMATPDQDRLNEDKELSVMVWHTSKKLRTLVAFSSIFKGEHIKHEKFIEILKGHEISVEFDRPCALQIDGETILGVTSYSARSAKVGAKVTE